MHPITIELEKNGLAVVSQLVTPAQLRDMQKSFCGRLKRLRWNHFDGYEKTERYRHTVQDVLMLDQSFVDIALHPLIKGAMREYLGNKFELVEAKGWKSLATNRDFHGWHGDAWYDQRVVKNQIPREVKLGIYLSDVKTGGFVYIKGSHRQVHPKSLRPHEIQDFQRDRWLEMTGPAGTAFLFDTSGIHRQNTPILDPRHAVFYCYHDPDVPLQWEDVEYYRYHPLHLNAAFLGALSDEDCRILGFGNKRNFQPGFERKAAHTVFQFLMSSAYDAKVLLDDFHGRVTARLTLRKKFEPTAGRSDSSSAAGINGQL